MLSQHNRLEDARNHFITYRQLFEALDEDTKSADPEQLEQASNLSTLLFH